MMGLDNKIFYLDNNDDTHINDGERDIVFEEPIKLNTIKKLGDNTYLYAQASRDRNIINIRKLDLNSATTSLVQSYSFNSGIFDESSLGLGESEKYLATPISNLDFDLDNKRFIVSIDDQYYGLPANNDPLTGKSLSTNSLLNKLKRNISSVTALKEKLANINNKSGNKALAHDDTTGLNSDSDSHEVIAQECKDMIISPEDTSLEGRQRLVNAIDCFSGFQNKTVQEKDILTIPIAIDGIYNLGQFDNSIEYLNNLVLNGKTFTIAKTASEYKYAKGLEYFANQLITFEGTKEQEQEALNNTLKNGGFFYGRQTGFNIAPNTGSNKVDYITENEKISLKLGGEALAGNFEVILTRSPQCDDPAWAQMVWAVGCDVTGEVINESGQTVATIKGTWSSCYGYSQNLVSIMNNPNYTVYYNKSDSTFLKSPKPSNGSAAPNPNPNLIIPNNPTNNTTVTPTNSTDSSQGTNV